MTPTEFWLQVAARQPRKTYGALSEDEVSEMYEDLESWLTDQ
jgi:hypothetical protein